MSPQGARHADAIRRLGKGPFQALASRAEAQVHLPLAASDESEPEPDLAVTPRGECWKDRPAQALLVIEVAIRVDDIIPPR